MTAKPKELTGRTVLIIALAAFGVILAANLTMLWAATGTFPGIVVKNGFVASQGWDARAEAQRALGWTSTVAHTDGEIQVRITDAAGAIVEGLAVEAHVGRPATQEGERRLALASAGDLYAAPATLDRGLWRVAFEARNDLGRTYSAEAQIFVGGSD